MPAYRKSHRGWLTGDTLAPITGRVLFIPGDLNFLMAVNGALTELTFPYNWEQFGTVTPEAAAEAMTIMLADYFQSEAPLIAGDSELWLFGSSGQVKVGNALGMVIDTTTRFNQYWQQNPAANGDKFNFRRNIDAGNWSYRYWYNRTTASAIVNIKIADQGGTVENVNLDMYGAALVNQSFTGTFTATEGGSTTIDLEIVGRNAANTTGWLNRLICIEMWKD